MVRCSGRRRRFAENASARLHCFETIPQQIMNRFRIRLTATLVTLALCFGHGYAQNRTRIYISTDNGHSWEPADAGFPLNATVNDFSVFGNAIFAGTDANGVFVSRDGARNWKRTGQGLNENLKINAVASTQEAILVGTGSDGVFASVDAGRTWQPARNGLTNLQIRRLAVHEDHVFAGTNGGLFASDDNGNSWSHLTGTGQINGITILKGNIYVADLQGVILSTNRGRTWRRILETEVPHNLSNDGASVFAMLYNDGVKKTDDEGATWINAQVGLPADLSQYTFQILHADGVLFAGQWNGIYISTDSGASWSPISQLPPNQPITDLIRLGDETIVAGAGLTPEE